MRMMRRRHLVATAAVTAAVGLGAVVTGCGGGGTAANATTGGSGQAAAPAATAPATTTSAPAPATRRLRVTIKSDEQDAKKGSDGLYHDAFLPADVTVKPGQRVVMRFRNFDDAPHSFTSPDLPKGGSIPKGDMAVQPGLTTMPAPGLGVDAVIPGARGSTPGTATVTFTAPSTAGRYFWFCKVPCDPWAMGHDGFMRGYVTVS